MYPLSGTSFFRTVRLWSFNDRKLLKTFNAHTDEIEVPVLFDCLKTELREHL